MIKRALVLGLWVALAGVFALELCYHFSHISFPSLLVPGEDGLYLSARAYQQGPGPLGSAERLCLFQQLRRATLALAGGQAVAACHGHGFDHRPAPPDRPGGLGGSGHGLPTLCGAKRVEALPALAGLQRHLSRLFSTTTPSVPAPDGLALALYLASLACAFTPGKLGWAGRRRASWRCWAPWPSNMRCWARPWPCSCSVALGPACKAAQMTGLSLCAFGALLGALIPRGLRPATLKGTYYVLGPAVRLSWAHCGAAEFADLDDPCRLGRLVPRSCTFGARGGGPLLAGRPEPRPGAGWRSPCGWSWRPAQAGTWDPSCATTSSSSCRWPSWGFASLGRPAGDPFCFASALVLLADAGSMMAYDLRACPLAPPSAAATHDWAEAADLVRHFPLGDYPPIMALQVEAYGSICRPHRPQPSFSGESTPPRPRRR